MNFNKFISMFYDTLIFWSGWFVGYYGICLIAFALDTDTDKANNYGLISGWWCALYFVNIFKIKVLSSVPIFISHLIVMLLSWHIGQFHYHDPPEKLTVSFFFMAVVTRSFFFTSPVFINGLIKNIIKN